MCSAVVKNLQAALMEDSPPVQSLILNPPETPFSFPPHRRRPLRSRTYGALIQILSHCPPQLQTQEPVNEKDGSITGSRVISSEALVQHQSKGLEDKVVQELSDVETKKNTGLQNFNGNHATLPISNQPGSLSYSEKALIPSNEISIEDYAVIKEKADICAVQNTKELANVNSVLDIQMDDFGTLKDVELDNDSCFRQLNEVLDSRFDLDTVVESSEAKQLSQDKGIVSEENIAKDMEHELQMAEVELEKLIYISGNTEVSLCQNEEDIEEGEISGDAGTAEESSDALSKGAVHGEETSENLHASEGNFDGEKLFCEDKDRGRQQHGVIDPLVLNIESNLNNVKNIIPAGQSQDCYHLDVHRGSYIKTPKSGDTSHCLDNLMPHGKILQKNAAENQTFVTTEMDEDAANRKRKRSLTKERRAKKKKKERLKRAEKNRESGVKRLKLPTIKMPKKIVYCRHYLQGRCHEGEKCKFSHDTVPLTKSKPCGHFARHSCMKGDDCPFDHQLSKYPCNNYTLNGFCSRGSECMFSHEVAAKSPSLTPSVSKHDLISPQQIVPEKEGSHPMSKGNKSEVKFPSPLGNPNSSRPIDNSVTAHQKLNSRLGSASNSTSQKEQLAPKSAPGTSGRVPKGVSFLLNVADTNKDKQDGSPAKKTDDIDGTLKLSGGINELNETPVRVAPRKPRGINFLSFGQPPSDNSSSKILSNLLSNYNDGAGKSAIDVMGKGKMNQSAINSVSDLKAIGTPLTLSQNVNFLSSNGSRLDASTSSGKDSLDFSRGDTALSADKETQSTSELQDTVEKRCLSFLGRTSNLSSSSFLSNTPTLVRKAVQSTLAFAAQLEPEIKVASHHHQIS